MLLLLALTALFRLPPLPGTLLSAIITCVALLEHEAFSLAFYPLLLAILWDRCRRRLLSWRHAALHLAAATAVFFLILHFGKLKVAPAVILADARQRTAVPIQPQVFEVMASNFTAQRALVSRFYHNPDFRLLIALTVIFSVPYFVLLARLLLLAGRARGYRNSDLAVLFSLFALPLSLCYLGHDIARWISACAIDATLFLAYLALQDSAAREDLRLWATGPRPLLWLAWFFLSGPYGASGLTAAEHFLVVWYGP
jgi:hypothetical protein